MRKCALMASLAVLAVPTHGQGSVSMYGIVDTGVSYYDRVTAAGGTSLGMPVLPGVPSRFGLRGSEDLGGNLKAFFVLENGFATNDGSLSDGGRLFGRLANLGVVSPYGKLTLGRQATMTMLALGKVDVLGPSIHSMGNFDTYLPNAHSDNTIGYLGTFRGVTVGATYSFGRDAAGPDGPSATNCPGEVPGDFVACRQYSAMLAYDAESFRVVGSYDVMRGGAGASAPLTSPAYVDTRTLLGSYAQIGATTIGVGWVRRNTAAATHVQSDIVFVGSAWSATPALTIDTQVSRYVQRREAAATLLVARANYLLSIRTKVYLSVGYMFNGQLAAYPVASGGSVMTGANQFGTMLGLQQRF
ncbi:porin [Paraburkholderia bannensis]|uniref:porin n=1 Tax=Paraburkholderia bannensis TaxID=765414 RepID=UPI002AB5EF8B|nr:porin [Paraburkholderia bannensis]